VITKFGFFFGGFPLVIVLRAATHVIFAVGGALFIRNRRHILDSLPKVILFAFVISIVHAVCEVAIVTPFYMGSSLKEAFYTQGYMMSVLGLVGVGTVVHSMVDFFIALLIWKPLRAMKSLTDLTVLPKTA
jgi:niacin transporter